MAIGTPNFRSLLVGIAAAFLVHADPVSISGIVKNQAGAAVGGAVVTLKGASMSAITNATGAYSLIGNLAVFGRLAQETHPSMAPRFAQGSIIFGVPGAAERVRIAIVDLRGRHVEPALDRSLARGNYTFCPALARLAPGFYGVSVAIGTTTTFLKLPFGLYQTKAAVLQQDENRSGSSALLKSAASVDSVQVSATDYTTIAQPIESYTGTYNFTLQPGYSLTYYRLRVVYINKGDWSGLAIKDTSKVITVRRMTLTGNPTASEANLWHLGLNQSDSALNAGGFASETVDFALLPVALNGTFDCRLDKGVAGSDTLRFYGVSGTTTHLLKAVALTSGSDISVDLSWFKNVPPSEAPMAPVPKMGVAVYYAWYNMGSWTSNQLKDHPATFYDSGDTLAIARQMDQAKSAGIGAFIESWAGQGTDSDNKLKLLLKVGQQKNFKIGIFFENTGDDTNAIYNRFAYLVTTYRDNPALLKVNNKPIATPFCTGNKSCATWKRILDRLHAAGLDVAVINDHDIGDSLSIFDGIVAAANIDEGRKVHYFSVLADSTSPKIYIPTAMPGFDERLIPGRDPPRYIDRQNGQWFASQLDIAMKAFPNWVEAYTWNEWWEETYIEPSVNYGDQYLQIFGSYVKPWMAQ